MKNLSNYLSLSCILFVLIFRPTYGQNNLLTPEKLWELGRVSDVQISPDGNLILFGVTNYNIEDNKGKRSLYVGKTDGSESGIIKDLNHSVYDARWRPDGEKIGFLSDMSGSIQLWEMDVTGQGLIQVTDFETDIANFSYAPDMNHISFSMTINLDKDIHDRHVDLPLAQAYEIDDLMYRHWDTWQEGNYSHLYISKYNKGVVIGNAIDIMEGQKYDWPLKPFGDSNDMCWSPDGTSLIYSSKKFVGKEYARNTNADLYLYDIKSKQTENLSADNPGYDLLPKYSIGGTMIAWLNMKRGGYESDRKVLKIYDMQSREIKSITENFEYDIEDFSWSDKDKTIYIIAGINATKQLFSIDLKSNKFEKIKVTNYIPEQKTYGIHNINRIQSSGETIICEISSMSLPTEIFKIDLETGYLQNISNINNDKIKNLEFGEVKSRIVKTIDDKDMLVWVIYPPGFSPDRKYPALLYCQGGPHGAVDQFFSYRWNFQIMAANNYIIVAPNRRGLPSFGDDWNDGIVNDWGGMVMEDYLAAIDDLAKEPYVDNKNLGAVGASYGGYSTFYLAGIHNNRFKTFITHDGVFNLESWYGSTEELFFPDWEFGGPYWEESNKEYYQKFSPHHNADKWNTPMLIIHGGKDYRIPYTQALEAFTLLKVKEIPAKLLFFPNENHWVLSPQNGILWQRTFFNWLDGWLKN